MSWINNELVNNIQIISIDPYDPVIVTNIPKGWNLLGKGNFAAVFTHASLDGKVVKIYAENRDGIKEEIQVYKKLGDHHSYSKLVEYGDRYLVLKKLEGITLFQAFRDGVYVPKTVIEDIDNAIEHAKQRGLNPTDIHGKNVIMKDGKGYIVDVSDFLKSYTCPKWKHFKKMYFLFYIPLFKKMHFALPFWLLERIRKAYQYYLLFSGFRRKQESADRKDYSH
jgi:predicted Ser/Thr protein kinase